MQCRREVSMTLLHEGANVRCILDCSQSSSSIWLPMAKNDHGRTLSSLVQVSPVRSFNRRKRLWWISPWPSCSSRAGTALTPIPAWPANCHPCIIDEVHATMAACKVHAPQSPRVSGIHHRQTQFWPVSIHAMHGVPRWQKLMAPAPNRERRPRGVKYGTAGRPAGG